MDAEAGVLADTQGLKSCIQKALLQPLLLLISLLHEFL